MSAVVSFFDEGTGALHPEDVRFSGTQAASMTHALGGTSIEPQAITLQAVDNSVCEGPKIGIVGRLFTFSIGLGECRGDSRRLAESLSQDR